MENRTLATISNYYGTPFVCIEEDKFYFAIDDFDNYDKVEVTKEFYDAFVKEFGEKD